MTTSLPRTPGVYLFHGAGEGEEHFGRSLETEELALPRQFRGVGGIELACGGKSAEGEAALGEGLAVDETAVVRA